MFSLRLLNLWLTAISIRRSFLKQRWVILVLFLAEALRSEAAGTVTRRFPAEVVEGQIIEVVLQAEPLVSALAFGVRETFPPGVEYISSNPQASYSSTQRQLRWGLFFDGRSRPLTYRIRVPSARTLLGWQGWLDEDGVSVPSGGPNQLVVQRPNPGSVTRILPAPVEAGGIATIRLQIRPRSGLQFQVIEETLPSGWSLIDLNQGGSALSSRQLRWGPWTDDLARDLTYRLRAPAQAVPGIWSGQSTLGEDLVSTVGASQLEVLPKSQGSVVRTFGSAQYTPGQTIQVRLSVKPPDSVGLYVVEESVPAGWTLSKIDADGRLSAGQLVWGVLAGSAPREFSYTLNIPESTSGTARFSGLGRFDANPVVTTGSAEIQQLELAKPKASRTLPAEYIPSLPFTVQVSAEPLAGSTLYLVEEDIPAGCTVDSAGTGVVSGPRIVWGPFLDDSPRKFSCRLLPSSQVVGNIRFAGRIRSSLGQGTITGGDSLSPRPPKSGRIEQSLPKYFLPGVPFTVSYRLIPESGVALHLLSQSIPVGWSVGEITGGGRWDPVQRRVLWGLFNDDQERTLLVEIRPTVSARGSYLLGCEAVFDGQNRSPSTSSSIVANLPPELSAVPAQTVAEDETLSLRVRASDPELPADQLTLSVTVEPSDLFPVANRSALRQGNDILLTLRPAAEASGSAVIRLALSDDVQTTRNQFDVTVLPVNDMPFVSPATGALGAVEDSDRVRVQGIQISDPDLGLAPVEVELEAASGAQWLEWPLPVGVQKLPSTNSSLVRLRGTLAPINQALSQIAFRPAADFFGTQILRIRANDLGSSGPGGPQIGIRDVEIDIAGINDPPGFQSLSGVVLTADEDATPAATSFPGFLKEIRVGPTNELSRQLILLQVVAEQPSLFSVQPSIDTANGRLRFTVATNVSGETWVTVQAVDTGGIANGGIDRSPVDRFLLRVEAVNDPPSWTLANAISGNIEDSPIVSLKGMRLSDPDVGGQPLDVTLELDSEAIWLERTLPEGLQRVGGSEGVLRWWGPLDRLNQALDELSFRTATNFFGTQNIRLTVSDLGSSGKGGAQVSSVPLLVSVTPVNDAPSFNALPADTLVSVDEDASGSKTVFTSFLTGIEVGPANEATNQALRFVVTLDNTNLFSQLPVISPSGELRFTPKPQAWGESWVTFYAEDNGGAANNGWNRSPTNTFRIIVREVNDPPQMTLSATNLTVLGAMSGVGVRTVPGFVRSASVGPADEVASGQRLSVLVSVDREEAFSELPSIDSDGRLSMTLSPYWSGTVRLTVSAKDDGSSNPPNRSESDSVEVLLKVVPENQPPIVVWSEGWKIPSPASGQTFLLPGVYPGRTEAFSDVLDVAQTTAEWTPKVGGSVSLPVVAYRSGRRPGFVGLAGLELRWPSVLPPLGAGEIRLNLVDQVGAKTTVGLPLEFVSGVGLSQAVNLPPEWSAVDTASGLPQRTALEDFEPIALELAPLVSGSVGPVTWSLQQPLDSRVVDAEIIGSTLWIRSLLNRSGSSWFQLRADASNGQFSWAFQLDVTPVADAPLLQAPMIEPISEGLLWSGLLTTRSIEYPGRPVVLRLEGAPSGLQMRSDGWLFWTPDEIQGPGDFSASIIAQDLAGGPESRVTLQFKVLEANLPPTLAKVSDGVLREGSSMQVRLSATDLDLPVQPLTYLWVSGPEGVAVSSEGLLQWTPTEDQGPGTYVLRVAVTDGDASVTNQFSVQVREVNEFPIPVAVSDQIIDETTPWTWTLRATDVDIPVQSLSFGLVSGPEGMSVSSDGLLKWTPTEVQGPGEFSVSWWVSDGVVSATNRFGLRVREVNESPVLVGITNAVLREGIPWQVRLLATDVDVPVQPLGFRRISGPDGLSLDSDGLLTWTPTETQGPGDYLLRFEVSDGVVAATHSFSFQVLEVNELPVPIEVPEQTIDENVAWERTLGATDVDVPVQLLSFGLASGPEGLAVSGDGLMKWTPTEAQGPADMWVSWWVSDGVASVTNRFRLRVREVNEAPQVELPPELQVVEGYELRWIMVGFDSDIPRQSLQFRVVQGPIGMTTTQQGLLTWRPGESQAPGTNQVLVAVGDGDVWTTNRMVVIATELNEIPVITPIPELSVVQGFELQALVRARDIDLPKQFLEYRLLQAPSGMTISTNGLLAWKTSTNQPLGRYPIRVRVSDGLDAVDAPGVVVVKELILPPTITRVGDLVWMENQVHRQQLIAVDANLQGAGLRWTLVQGPPGLILSPSGVLEWNPDEELGGTAWNVTVSVSNGILSSAETFQIRVLEDNVLPSWGGDTLRFVTELEPLSWSLPVMDSDLPAQSLNFQKLSGPDGLMVQTNGWLTWTPTEAQGPSTNRVRVSVSDGLAMVPLEFDIVVRELNQVPVWVTPALTRRVSEGVLLSFPVVATDADLPAQPLTYRVVSAPWGMTLSTNGVVSWRPTEIQGPSTNRVRITVSDGVASVPLEFDVIVRDAITGSPGPTLSLSPRLDGSWTLRVAGIGGGRYQVEQLTQLGGTWVPVSGVPEVVTQGVNTPVDLLLPSQSVSSRFIRLVRK